jgi:hypothetical protein
MGDDMKRIPAEAIEEDEVNMEQGWKQGAVQEMNKQNV